MRITGLKNPSNTLPPSNSFQIFVDTSGNFKIDSKETSLYATPSIQAGPLTSVTITRSTNVVGADTTYTIKFTTSNSITQANGVFLTFTSPSGLLYTGTTVSCAYKGTDVSTTSSYGSEITTFKVPMSCGSTG